MRWITLRILGTDVVELGVGRQDPAGDAAEPPVSAMPGPHSADLDPTPIAFGFGASSPHDEPIELE